MLTFFAVHSDILRGSRLVILTSITVDPDILRGFKMTFVLFHDSASDKYRVHPDILRG